MFLTHVNGKAETHCESLRGPSVEVQDLEPAHCATHEDHRAESDSVMTEVLNWAKYGYMQYSCLCECCCCL